MKTLLYSELDTYICKVTSLSIQHIVS